MSLNEASTNIPYTLGRLFSVYESAQQAANPGINATIKDKYFNSAATMPASIFPVLNNLYQKHLRKLEPGQRVYFDKQVTVLKGCLLYTSTLTTDDVPGDETRCSITYADLPQDVKPGNTILLDDGLVRLTVLETTAREIRCRVENDGVMKDKKGVNVPGVSLSMPYMSQRDREDILFGIRQGFDFIAASFVRSAADVREIRHILDKNHSKIRIIAKIENQEGVSNLVDILSVADGIMVARGDMGVEIDFTEIPAIQKSIIAQCVAAGKMCIRDSRDSVRCRMCRSVSRVAPTMSWVL